MTKRLSRREFAKGLVAGAGAGAAAAGMAGCEPSEVSLDLVLPPTNALVQSTVCAYCIVGCGYKVYSWPVTDPPGLRAADYNALGVDYPTAPLGPWISPEMHNVVTIGGEPHHIVVLPDPDATVVNLGGDHTLGASLAQKLYNPDKPTADRLLRPQLRTESGLVEISWDDALDLIATYSTWVIETWGVMFWAMKTYSYQFYENTYAITKLAFDAVETPCWAPHDKTAEGSDTPGLSDAGINVFSASYQDWYEAEVIFCSGVSLYDAHGVLFSQWVARGGARLVVVNPRRDPTADWALNNGGLFLQLKPGTDTALHNALCWIILTERWYDLTWIDEWCCNAEDLVELGQSKWRQATFATTFDALKDAVLADPDALPSAAAEICGIDEELIWEAAELLAKPDDTGRRPLTSMMLEKGNYWSHNYPNTASFAALALLVGAGNRPGRVVSRAGGHQRGMIKAAAYPEHLSPHSYRGNPIGCDLDAWVLDGNVAFCWVIGCTWAGGGGAASNVLFESIRNQTRMLELTDNVIDDDGNVRINETVGQWVDKAMYGGMVLVQSDLYPQRLTELADLILPAAGWGEATFSRMQGERRLRLYPQLVDPPGECRPDWQAIAGVAQRMGYAGFDWESSNELFETCAAYSSGPHAFQALVEYASDNGLNARQVLRETGTTGLQCPLSYEDGEIKETARYHDAETGRGFSTPVGKACFVLSQWRDVESRQEDLSPRSDELWVINRRASTNWSALVEDLRIPFRADLLPVNYLEMHPSDAENLDLDDGDAVSVENDNVSAAYQWVDDTTGRFEAVIRISDRLRRGVTCAYFNFGGDPDTAANGVVSNSTEPITNKNSFKLGRGRIRRLS